MLLNTRPQRLLEKVINEKVPIEAVIIKRFVKIIVEAAREGIRSPLNRVQSMQEIDKLKSRKPNIKFQQHLEWPNVISQF